MTAGGVSLDDAGAHFNRAAATTPSTAYAAQGGTVEACGTHQENSLHTEAGAESKLPVSKHSAAGGFDFENGFWDVLHLGDCDGAVQQLAALLGWQHELQGLIDAGRAAFNEAMSCWQD